MRTELTLKDADKSHVKILEEGICFRSVETDEQLEAFLNVISNDLNEQEAAVLIYRHGLENGTTAKSLLETSEIFGVSREKVRQVEYNAFVKLKHPHRIMRIFGEDKPKISTVTVDSEIKECDLLTRTINILTKLGVKTVKDLLDLRLENFFRAPGLTNQVINDVNTFIRYINS